MLNSVDIDGLLGLFEDLKESEKLTDNEYKTGLELVSRVRSKLISIAEEEAEYMITIRYHSPYIKKSVVLHEIKKIVVFKTIEKRECPLCDNQIDCCDYKRLTAGVGNSMTMNSTELLDILDIDLTDFIEEYVDLIVISQRLE